MITVHVGSSNLVQWDRMKDPSTGHYVNLATVTFTVYDSGGDAVSGCSAVSMPNVSGSDGQYQGWIPPTAGLVVGSRYVLQATATWGSNVGVRRELLIAQYRGFA